MMSYYDLCTCGNNYNDKFRLGGALSQARGAVSNWWTSVTNVTNNGTPPLDSIANNTSHNGDNINSDNVQKVM